MIVFNGTPSSSCGLIVERYPNRALPKRKYETISIPGRNGDIVISQDAYENVEQEYEVYLSAEAYKLPIMARKVAEWLLQKGYCRLADTYEPDVYRLAYYNGTADIENILNRFGRMKISFSCKPQRFLTSGETEVAFTAAGVLNNQTAYTAKPLITVKGTGSGTVTIGSTTFTLTGISQYITIDCDLQDAYKGNTNENAKFTGNFPELIQGNNSISFTGDVTEVDITPRWWVL